MVTTNTNQVLMEVKKVGAEKCQISPASVDGLCNIQAVIDGKLETIAENIPHGTATSVIAQAGNNTILG